jgi:hypothetical protein
MPRKLLIILLLVLAGLSLIPLEKSIHVQRVKLKYGNAGVPRDVRYHIPQGMAVGLLAGFRGVVADFLWIQSHDYWEKKEWIRQYNNMDMVTTLQPLSILFWDLASWHMAWNIGYAVRTDPKNPTEAVGIKRERDWQLKARDFLIRGIENNPNKYDLYFKLGWLYWQKFVEVGGACDAARYFGQAAEYAEAPKYIGRIYAQALERCGQPEEAYKYWIKLWHQPRNTPNQLWNVIEREIVRIEDLLNIPSDQRVPRNPNGSLRIPQ